jgi:very-short-patch-repair endonuclease
LDRLLKNDEKIKSLLIKSIHQTWSNERRVRIGSLETGALKFTSLYNKRGAAGQRRNSLRKIIDRDFKLFTALYPVVICNPGSATALFRLEKDLFDVVLFDEASQLRLEDTYTSLYRGKTKIISGDEHQMPPSSYYQSSGTEEDEGEYESDEDIQAGESAHAESLLDYARINSYQKNMLKVHYRSEHQDLIEFSNHAFYGGSLMPIPKLEDYAPIEFHEVTGLYTNRTNEDEAKFVISWLRELIEMEEQKSVGIVTLNLPQAELIKEMIARERTADSDFNSAMVELEEREFFVKNLENVQGDERDIVFLSTTFGIDDKGKFRQGFGPLSTRQGYRLLNVLVTRAKFKFIVATSIPLEYYSRYEEEIGANGNNGNAIFYAYLAYARAVSKQDQATKQHILNVLNSNSSSSTTQMGDELTESPFEEEVLDALEAGIDKDRIKLQYEVGGRKFRIDMVILNRAKTRPMLAIECDGYAYHSSPQAHLYDIYREQILRKKGFVFHRIWSTNWFHDQQNETRKLLQKIQEMDDARDPALAR